MNLKTQTTHLEARNKTDIKTATALALRFWQAARFSKLDSDARIYMQRANHTTLTAHRRNPSHLEMYCLTIFIAIEAGHYDNANEMLDKAMEYKAFLRGSAPMQYAVLCFLYAYLEIRQNRTRSAKKHWRALTDHFKSNNESVEFSIMQGLLHLASDEYSEAYNHLREAFRKGSSNIFLYEGLYRYYNLTPNSPEGGTILAVLIYAAERGVDTNALAERHQTALLNAAATNPEAGERLYAVSSYPPLLQQICAHRISKSDFSDRAYQYYKEAESKQITVGGLFHALVQAAYKNKAPGINHYALAKFLETANLQAGDTGLAVYVYHLILTTPELEKLLPERQKDMMKLAETCIQTGVAGREVNSLYYYYWSKCKELDISDDSVANVEEILRNELTMFELTTAENSSVRHVYITEPQRRGMSEYDMTGESVTVEASSPDLSYTCLGVGKRAILDEKLTVRRMIPGADPKLYQYFFNKGDRRFFLLTYLTDYYLAQDSPPDAAISVFEEMLVEKSIANAYRMRILLALGRIHYNAFSFEEALACYGEIDEDALDNDFTGQMLRVYMQTNEAERAVRLLARKHPYIAKDVLFESVCALLTKQVDHTPLSGAAYSLLLGGYYTEAIMELVLKHYQAGYSEWTALAKVVENDMRIDIRILETALWMAQWDEESQWAFVRVYSTDSAAEIVEEFIEYAKYEIFTNAARPEYDTLEILEFRWEETRDVILTWGLASCYLRHNITTFKSEEIIAHAIDVLENEGILFPVFKESRFARVPFIEKYQPFIYRGTPGKDYLLHYRIDDATTFTTVPMQYVKYGLYVTCLPLFYNEEVTYFFSEEMATGSIATKEETVKNMSPFLYDHPTDPFFAINNAITYEHMFKHDQVERMVSGLVKDVQVVRSGLM